MLAQTVILVVAIIVSLVIGIAHQVNFNHVKIIDKYTAREMFWFGIRLLAIRALLCFTLLCAIGKLLELYGIPDGWKNLFISGIILIPFLFIISLVASKFKKG